MYDIIVLQPAEQRFEDIPAKYVPTLVSALLAEYVHIDLCIEHHPAEPTQSAAE